ncbi:hypothetical protein CPB84DRAFT_1796535 [Gymnopilus junonius]|uniref:Uncharacterized protein n=1 Tax=Gymnopilus junonius TaxID=109634 RepID=A0A9P5N9I2_GYMJU|nr:hypothetical protein CPB84DRAFT_1796535 [Gymnopilus junonius]
MDDVANRVLELVRPVIEQISEKMRKSVLERLDEGFGTLGKDKGKGKDRAMDIDEEKHEAEDMDIIDSSAEKEQNGKKIIEVLGILVDRVKDMGRDVKNIGNDLHTMKIVLGIPRALGVDNGGGGNGPFALAGRKRRRNGPDDEIEEITELGSARQVPFEVKQGQGIILPMIRGYEGSVIDVDADDGEMRSTAGAVVRAGEVEDRYVVMREVEAGLQLEPESEQEGMFQFPCWFSKAVHILSVTPQLRALNLFLRFLH